MLTSRGGLSPVMVGRSEELERLVGLLRNGQSTQVALVGGEPGIGKTRLVQELLAQIPAGMTILTGQPDPTGLGRPFGLIRDVLAGIEDLDEGLADLAGIVGDTTHAVRERIDAGLELVSRLLSPGPAVLILEDLHWADAESLTLFERMAEVDRPLLLVGTYRPDAVDRRHPVSDLMQQLERRHSVSHLWLARLALADVVAFLDAVYGHQPTYRVAVALHARTGGNPFFLEELLKSAGSTDVNTLVDQPLPWNLAEAFRSQLEDLDPVHRRVVETAAVLGQRVSFDLLAAVTGMAEDELIEVLRELVRRGLLVETADDEFGFRHALAKEAVAGELLGRQRRRLHEAAFETLTAMGSADLAAISRHAGGAGRYEDMLVAARKGAAQYLANGSVYPALKLAERGLEESPDDSELLGTAAEAAWYVGLLPDADAYARRWLAVARGSQQRLAALRMLIVLAWESDDTERLGRLTDEVCNAIPDLPAEDQARATQIVAYAFKLQHRLEEAVEWADRAIGLADELGLTDVRLAALVEKGSATSKLGDHDKGRTILLEAADAAEPAGEYLLAARALSMAIYQADPPNLDMFPSLLKRMRDAAERIGFYELSDSEYHQGVSYVAMWQGDLAAAIEALEEGRRTDRGYLQASGEASYRLTTAGLALEAGELDRAEVVRRELEMYPQRSKPRLGVLGLDFHMACRRGDVAAAREVLPELIATLDELGSPHLQSIHDLVSAGLFGGLSVEELAPLAERRLNWHGRPMPEEEPLRVLVDAQMAEAAGKHEDALAGYVAAAASGYPQIMPSQRGTAWVGAARCLIALGRAGEAREHVDAAAELLARWSGWRRAEVEAVQRRLGIGAPSSGPDGLTPREREVAALLAEGLTNAELAKRLFISRKTAAVHVSNILAKLRMGSRAQVAAWVSREGLSE